MKHHVFPSVASPYRTEEVVAFLARSFERDGYVPLPGLLSATSLAAVSREIENMKAAKTARHFIMPGLGTPRIMETIGGQALRDQAPVLGYLYHSRPLRAFLSRIAGQPVRACGHPSEWAVVNFLSAEGSTHGWHFDDPPLALVMILEAPAAEAGGLMEFVPRTVDRQRAKVRVAGVEGFVAAMRADRKVRSAHHVAGEAYLLRADRCLHRVNLLKKGTNRRVAVNFAYELDSKPRYGNTASFLYD